jgi:three-Cys-motif partner protein
VAVPDETIWDIEPHTVAKHEILRAYLNAWYPILSMYNAKIVYVDGFAGPGQYAGGEPGSPIIALESALTQRSDLTRGLSFWFIEERADRRDHLNAQIAKLTIPAHLKVNVELGTFADNFPKVLQQIEGDRSPTFALIDPFGFAGIPYTLVKRLLAMNKCEVLITVMVDSINRWLTHPDQKIQGHVTEAFGTEEALQIANGSGDRANALKDLYNRQLKRLAKFVRYFEMRDKESRIIYYLFFASNNPLGHLKMKEAMWKVDPMGDFSFSDSTNPAQQVLFESPVAEDLAANLASHFKGHGQMDVKTIERHVNDETAYIRKHMRDALKLLQSKGGLKVADKKADGKPHKPGTFPTGALVTFL